MPRYLHSALVLAVAAVAAESPVGPAHAEAITIDDFAVTRNGTAIFDDNFAQNAVLSGSTIPTASTAITGLPSVPNFLDDSTPATYFVQGSIVESSAGGGQALLNTANGVRTTQPDPFFPNISRLGATLQTGPSPTGPGSHELTAVPTFAVSALFNLTLPPVIGATYDVNLSNRDFALNGGRGDEVQLRVRHCSASEAGCAGVDGLVLQFEEASFVANTLTLLDQVTLDTSHQQILLELTHDAANSDTIGAAFAYVDNGIEGAATSVGNTTSATDPFTAENFLRAGFEAYEPVPEPGSTTLLGSGLLGVVGTVWLRRRHSRS